MCSRPSLTKTFSSVAVVCSNSPLLCADPGQSKGESNRGGRGKEENIPEAAHLHLLRPHLLIKPARPVLVEHHAVVVLDDAAQAVPDEEARDAEADEDAEHRQDRHPLLLGVLLLEPGLLDLALLDAPRVEVALAALLEAAPERARAAEARRRPRRLGRHERVGRRWSARQPLRRLGLVVPKWVAALRIGRARHGPHWRVVGRRHRRGAARYHWTPAGQVARLLGPFRVFHGEVWVRVCVCRGAWVS